jgi:hypothetical protein
MIKYFKGCLVWLFVVISLVAVYRWQGPHSLVFAWVLNLILMMGVSYITQTFKPSLASTYYDSKSWEANGAIYKWFGIDAFRKILVWVGWEKLNKAENPVKKSLQALKHLEYNTRQSEFGHLIPFFIVLIVSLFVAFRYGAVHSLWLVSLNIILNVYPIILQRYNRPRLQRALRIREST